jgi:hypothetical protein
MDTKVKNMAYWKAKNGIVTDTPIPGISHTSDGNEKDGRSPSSAFQQKTGHIKREKFIEGKENKPTKPIAGTGGGNPRIKIIDGIKHIWDTVKNMWKKA